MLSGFCTLLTIRAYHNNDVATIRLKVFLSWNRLYKGCFVVGGEGRERHPQANLPSILTLSIHIKLRFLVPRKLEIVNTEGGGISITIHTWNVPSILGVFRYRLYPE